jgi:hypothetical protein
MGASSDREGKRAMDVIIAFFAVGGAWGGAFLFTADEEVEQAGWWQLIDSLAPDMGQELLTSEVQAA